MRAPVPEGGGSCTAGDQWSPVKIRVNTKPAGLAGHKAHTTTVPIHVDARASSLQCFQVHISPTLQQESQCHSQAWRFVCALALAAMAHTAPLAAMA